MFKIQLHFVTVFIFIITVYAQENPDTLYFKNGRVFPCKIKDMNTLTLEVLEDDQKHTVLVKILDKIFLAGHGFIEATTDKIQQHLDLQDKLQEELPTADTLYFKSGMRLACSVKNLTKQTVKIIQDDWLRTVLIKLLDKIYITNYGPIDLSDSGLQAYLDRQQVNIPQPPLAIKIPDTLYFKTGGIYPCYIENIADNAISIKFKDQKRTVFFKLIDRIYLHGKGIFYPGDTGFQDNIAGLNEFAEQRMHKPEIPLPASEKTRATTFSIGGGLSVPSGEGSEYWTSGFNIFTDVNFPVSGNLAIVLHLAYNRWSLDEEEFKRDLFQGYESQGLHVNLSGSISAFEIAPALRLMITAGDAKTARFFAHIAGGFFILDGQAEASATYYGEDIRYSVDESENKFGISTGAGFLFGRPGSVNFSVYPLFNIVFTEEESTKYFVINMGIIFGYK